MTWSYRGSSIDDAVLGADYNLLESQACLCTAGKKMGQPLCQPCLQALAADDRAKLEALKPAEGIADLAGILHERMWRKRRMGRV